MNPAVWTALASTALFWAGCAMAAANRRRRQSIETAAGLMLACSMITWAAAVVVLVWSAAR